MKSRWRTQYEVLEGSSNFHKKVGQILSTDPLFKNMKCFQEVPVPDLISDYPHQHRVDWYIQDLNCCIELNGAQHYKVVNRGNRAVRDARRDFMAIQYRDSLKKTALELAGFEFREVHYRLAKKLDSETLKQIIFSEETSNE